MSFEVAGGIKNVLPGPLDALQGPYADAAAANAAIPSTIVAGENYRKGKTVYLANGTTFRPHVWASPYGDGDLVPLGIEGPQGEVGPQGWTQVFVEESDGARIIKKLSGYTGGEGDAPTANIGQWLKADGTFTSVKAEAKDYVLTGKIAPWAAGSYASNFQVTHLGKIWTSNAAIISTDVPGTSSKWVEDLTGYSTQTDIGSTVSTIPYGPTDALNTYNLAFSNSSTRFNNIQFTKPGPIDKIHINVTRAGEIRFDIVNQNPDLKIYSKRKIVIASAPLGLNTFVAGIDFPAVDAEVGGFIATQIASNLGSIGYKSKTASAYSSATLSSTPITLSALGDVQLGIVVDVKYTGLQGQIKTISESLFSTSEPVVRDSVSTPVVRDSAANPVVRETASTPVARDLLTDPQIKYSRLTLDSYPTSFANITNLFGGGTIVNNSLILASGGTSGVTGWKYIRIPVDPSKGGVWVKGIIIRPELTSGGGYWRLKEGVGGETIHGSFVAGEEFFIPLYPGVTEVWINIRSTSEDNDLGYANASVSYEKVPKILKVLGMEIAGTGGSGGGSNIEGAELITDLPVSDGSDIDTGYAYINNATGLVTVKL